MFAFSKNPTGRFGALKVVGVERGRVAILALDVIAETMPTLEDLRHASMLFDAPDENPATPSVGGRFLDELVAAGVIMNPNLLPGAKPVVSRFVPTTYEIDLDGLTPVGSLPVLAAERALIDQWTSTSSLINLGYAVERIFRLAFDRDAYLAEQVLHRKAEQEKREAEQLRYESRLKGLTWSVLLSEKLFPAWSEYPPSAFADSVRLKFRDVMIELQALGKKPKRAEVRLILRELIAWLNAEDDASGNPIETVEREHIHMLLEEILHVTRQPQLLGEIIDLTTF